MEEHQNYTNGVALQKVVSPMDLKKDQAVWPTEKGTVGAIQRQATFRNLIK